LGGFQIIDYLGKLIAGQLVAECFYLNDYLIFNEKIQVEQSDLLAFVHDGYRILLFNGDFSLPEFCCQGIFINFFFIARPYVVMDSHRCTD